MTERTKAWYEFNRRMLNARPWPGPQRLRDIQGLLSIDGLMHLVMNHRGIGRLMLGEPGDARPYAECRCFSDGSGFILISGGLLDFVEAVHAVIVAGARLNLPEGASVDPKITPDELDEDLLGLYTAWQSLKGTENRLVTQPDFDPAAQNYFDKRFLATRLFILMHEQGHAALHGTMQPQERKPDHELEADVFALVNMLKFARPGVDRETLIAGSTLMPRIYKALEIMGHKFAETHPPPNVRIAALLNCVRSVATTEFEYYGLTGHSRVQDLRMSAAERKFAGIDDGVGRFSGEDIIFSVTSGARSIASEPATQSFDEARANVMSYLALSDAGSRCEVDELWKHVEGSAYPQAMPDRRSHFEKCMGIARQLIQSLPKDDRALFGNG